MSGLAISATVDVCLNCAGVHKKEGNKANVYSASSSLVLMLLSSSSGVLRRGHVESSTSQPPQRKTPSTLEPRETKEFLLPLACILTPTLPDRSSRPYRIVRQKNMTAGGFGEPHPPLEATSVETLDDLADLSLLTRQSRAK